MPDLQRLMTDLRMQADAIAALSDFHRREARRWMLLCFLLGVAALSTLAVSLPAWQACREEIAVLRAPPLTGGRIMAAVAVERFGRLGLQLPPKPDPTWKPASEGCPPNYTPINDACWLEVKEAAPCPTTYHRQGKCYIPLRKAERYGVSDPTGATP